MTKTNINKPTEYSLIDNNKKYLPSRFVFVPTICLTSNSETIGNAITEQTYYNVENDDFVCKITHKTPSEPSSRIVCKTDEENVYVYKYKNSDGNIEYVACLSENLKLDNVLIGQNFNATNVTVEMSYDGQDVALSYFYDTSGDESLKHTKTDNGNIPYIQVPNNYDNLEINTNNIFYKDERTGNKKTYVIKKLTENDNYKVITNLSKKDKVLTENDDGSYKINDSNITLRNILKNEIESGYLNYLFVMEGFYVTKQDSPDLTFESYINTTEVSAYVNDGFNEIKAKNTDYTDYNVWSYIDEVEETLKNNITEGFRSKNDSNELTLVSKDLMNLNLEKKSLKSLQSDLETVQTLLDSYSGDNDLQNVKTNLQSAQARLSEIQQFSTQYSTLLLINETVQTLLDSCSGDNDLQNVKTNLQSAQSDLQSAIDYTNKTKDFLDHIRFLKEWFKENTLFSIYSENNFLGNVHKNNSREINAYWNTNNQPDTKIKQICNNFEKDLFYLDTEKNMIVAENDGNCELICQELSGKDRILPDGDYFITTDSTSS